MKIYKGLYEKIVSLENLHSAFRSVTSRSISWPPSLQKENSWSLPKLSLILHDDYRDAALWRDAALKTLGRTGKALRTPKA